MVSQNRKRYEVMRNKYDAIRTVEVYKQFQNRKRYEVMRNGR